MKRPSFWQGVGVAALFAGAASAIVAALLPFVGTVAVARLAVSLLSAAYILYLLSRSGIRVGRVVALTLWALVTVASWCFVSSFALYVLIHVLMLWLVRALYFYSGILCALLDGGLVAIGTVAALATLHQTGSTLLAVWAFFLTQALFAAIPRSMKRVTPPAAPLGDDHYQTARQRAEAALAQLIGRR